MPTYEIEWTTAAGNRMVSVEAEVSAEGGVSVKAVHEDGMPIYLGDFMTAERLGLYEQVRRAEGICTFCCGSKKVVRCERGRGGKPEESLEKCFRCNGTGREPS